MQNNTGAGDYTGLYYSTGEIGGPHQYILLNPCNGSGKFKSVVTNKISSNPGWQNEETAASGTATDAGWGLYTVVIKPDCVIGYYNGKQVSYANKTVKIADFGTNLCGYIG